MRLSVIIPTFSRPDELMRCLKAVSEQVLMSSSSIEVIVSNDGGPLTLNDLTEKFLAMVQVIDGPRRGPAANRNSAASRANGEWLLFTDDDSVPEPGWIEGLLTGLKNNPELSVFEGRVTSVGDRTRLDQGAPLNETGGLLWSCNFAITRELFRSINGFSEQFPHPTMEDVELRIRLEERGIKAKFLPDMVVAHPWTRREGFGFYVKQLHSIRVLIRLHPEQRNRITPWFYLRFVAREFAYSTVPLMARGVFSGFFTAMGGHLGALWVAYNLWRDQLR